MIRIAGQCLVLLLFGAIGCRIDTPLGSQRFKVVGIVVTAPVPGGLVSCDLSGIALRDESLVRAIDINAGDLIETENIVQLSARQLKSGVFFDYGVLMGPNPLTSRSVLGWFENSEPTIGLRSVGWVYVEGEQTRAKSEWVSVATRGSAIVLQKVSSNLQRVFFLNGAYAKITCIEDDSQSSTLNADRTYLEIGPDCAFSAPIELDAPTTPADVKSFIDDYVLAAAAASGLTP